MMWMNVSAARNKIYNLFFYVTIPQAHKFYVQDVYRSFDVVEHSQHQ